MNSALIFAVFCLLRVVSPFPFAPTATRSGTLSGQTFSSEPTITTATDPESETISSGLTQSLPNTQSAGSLTISETGETGTVHETSSVLLSSSVTKNTPSRSLSYRSATRSPNTVTIEETPTDEATPSFTMTDSISLSRTDQGRRFLCKGLPVEIRAYVSMPLLGPSISPSQTIKLETSVIMSSGYVLHFNITSCHYFAPLLTAATVSGNSIEDLNDLEKESGNGPRYQANTTTVDTMNFIDDLLDNGREKVREFGSFLSLHSQNPFFLQWTIDGPTSATLRIGPDINFGVPDPERIAFMLPASAFDPEPPTETRRDQIVAAFNLLTIPVPNPLGSPRTDERTVMSLTVSILALMLGNAQVTTIAGRTGAVLSAAACPMPLEGAQVRVDQNPLDWTFGTEKRLRYVAGGAFLNPLLVVAVCSLHFVVLLLVTFMLDKPLTESMAFIRFPSVLALPLAVFLYQGTVFDSLAALGSTDAFLTAFLTASSFVMLCFFPIFSLVLVLPINFRPEVVRASAENPTNPSKFLLRFFFGTGKWVDRTQPSKKGRKGSQTLDIFVQCYGPLFAEYGPNRQWFLSVELALQWLLGVCEATSPSTSLGCILVSVFESLFLWVYVVLLVGLHPYHTTAPFFLAVLVGLVQLAASILVTVGHVSGGNTARMTNITNILHMVAISGSALRCVLDMAFVVFSFVNKNEISANVARWRVETTRKQLLEKRTRHRLARIDAVLDSDEPHRHDDLEKHAELNEDANIMLEDYDERSKREIRSSVLPVKECASANDEEAELFLQRTAMTKEELWRAL